MHGANGYRPGYVPAQPSPSAWQYSEPPLVDRATQPTRAKSAPQDEEEDPDLRAAIEASLMEANAPKPSAPIVVETPRTEEAQFTYSGAGYSQSYPPGVVPPHPSVTLPNYDLEPLESDAILTFSQTVEQVQSQGGRDMSRYPAVNELYDKANSLRPKLAMSLDDAGRKERESSVLLSRACAGTDAYRRNVNGHARQDVSNREAVRQSSIRSCSASSLEIATHGCQPYCPISSCQLQL